ncbi:MAG: YfhO family protein [Anaerolineae bacterium]|nr:YfhO family protein [Anaerolineae bacterium]
MPLAFNLLVVLHLLIGGLGLYAFLKSEGVSDYAALIGGVSFELMPKIFGHYAYGHISLIYAVCWTPWLLRAEKQRLLKQGSAGAQIFPAVFLSLMLLADVRWAAYAAILMLVYSIFSACGRSYRTIAGSLQNALYMYGNWCLGMMLQLAFACLLAAPLLLPLVQFISLSTRSQMEITDQLAFSLSLVMLFGLLLPKFGAYAEWLIYPGGLSLLALITILGSAQIRKRYRFWLYAILVSFMLSLGSFVPFGEYIFKLPLLNLLRVPPRILFIAFMSFSILNACLLDTLIRRQVEKQKDVLYVAFIFFVVCLSVGLSFIGWSAKLEFFWLPVQLILLSLLFSGWKRCKIKGQIAASILYVLVILDMGIVGFVQIRYRSAAEVFSEGGAVANYLSGLPGVFRVYSPSYSIPQHTAAMYGLRQADGVDPMQLQSYVSFMEKTTGVPVSGYSVTLPPFESGNPRNDNRGYIPDARRLGLLNVCYVSSVYEIKADGLKFVGKFEDVFLYENIFCLPRVWLQRANDATGKNLVKVSFNVFPNKVFAEASGPGLLVLSQVDYPGWQVYVNGEQTQKVTVENLLPGVILPEGKHHVVFVFRPVLLYIGLGLGGLSWAFTGFLVLRRR